MRTSIGEDPRTADMPRVNVEVNDGVADLRGVAPSEDAKAGGRRDRLRPSKAYARCGI